MPRNAPFRRFFRQWASFALPVFIAICPLAATAEGAANVLVWDTMTRGATVPGSPDRSSWKVVPADLLMLEADPAKASSDPGYYGREYIFKGDLAVENSHFLGLFSAANGQMTLLEKRQTAGSSSSESILQIAPLNLQSGEKQPAIDHYELIANAHDDAVVQVYFTTPASEVFSVTFTFGKNATIGIQPSEKLPGIRVSAPISYGIVPAFVGDDLIFGQPGEKDTQKLNLPVESMFMALLKGESHALVMTWPAAKQKATLNLAAPGSGAPFGSFDIQTAGQSFYLTPMSAPGIWRREQLTSAFLEKTNTIAWKKPFPAKWKTQLIEAGVKTSFSFRAGKGTVWRGVPGMYNYPVWFEGDTAFYNLSKKVPPKGESLIYFLEGSDTPADVATPADILRSTLGLQAAADLLDLPGRKLRTHHRRGECDVHRACTCGYTEAIQSVFEAGDEVLKKDFIRQSIEDMTYFVQRHLERIDEYRRMSGDLSKLIDSRVKAAPELQAYGDELKQLAQRISEEYNVQRDNMKSLEFAGTLTQRTMALTNRKDPKNLQAYMDLLKEWRAMGGAQDYLVAQCHALTRKLFQDAGYSSVSNPKAVELAIEVRNRCRQTLRNPDGYEIWPNY
jgi:hypothetical protein